MIAQRRESHHNHVTREGEPNIETWNCVFKNSIFLVSLFIQSETRTIFTKPSI